MVLWYKAIITKQPSGGGGTVVVVAWVVAVLLVPSPFPDFDKKVVDPKTELVESQKFIESAGRVIREKTVLSSIDNCGSVNFSNISIDDQLY